MLVLIFSFLLLSTFSFSQSDSIDCDYLHTKLTESMVDMWCEKVARPLDKIDSIQSRIIFPKEALENKIEGIVYVSVIVDSVGNAICPKVIKSIGYGCDEEAIRVIMTSKYTPTICNRKPITTVIAIPVSFKIK